MCIEVDRLVNSIFGSNTYLISQFGQKECYLIDCGDVQPIIDIIESRNLILKGIFITHTHFDHIYGLNDITLSYPLVKIYTSDHGKDGLYSDKLNMSRYHLHPFIYYYSNVEILKDREEINLFNNYVLEVYETPGHDWSSCCYKIGDYIFTGDSYLPQYNLITNFPKSNKDEALLSLILIKYISHKCYIYPGHGEITSIK